MRTMFLLVTGMVLCMTIRAQEVIKLRPDDTLKDSIVYQNKTSILVINRVDLTNYMLRMDSLLKQSSYSNRLFRNVQFSHLTPEEVESHFTSAITFLADSSNTDLQYNTEKFTLFWTESEGILLPYIEELLSELLTDARIKVIDKSTKASVPQYSVFYEDISGQAYKIYKLSTGKIIFRESNYYVEQYATTK